MKFSFVAKASTFAFFLALASTAQAESVNPKFTGAYVGVTVGGERVKTSLEPKVAGVSFKNSNATIFGINGGYSHMEDSLFMALEGFLEGASHNRRIFGDTKDNSLTYKSGATLGVTGRLGAAVTQNVVLYGSLGLGFTSDTYEEQYNIVHDVSRGIVTTSSGTSTVKTTKTVVTPGIGAEVLVPDTNCSVRLDLTHTLPYKAKDTNGLKVSKTALKIGLAYRF